MGWVEGELEFGFGVQEERGIWRVMKRESGSFVLGLLHIERSVVLDVCTRFQIPAVSVIHVPRKLMGVACADPIIHRRFVCLWLLSL